MCRSDVWAKIDLEAIKENIQTIKKKLSSNVKICAVIKADAYGHGALPVSSAALSAGADMLAAAILPEALELRKSGIAAPILVLGFTPEAQSHLVAAADITQTVYSKESALALSAAAKKAKTKIKTHIKIDTGMGRIGLEPEDAADFAEFVANLPGLVLEGVFSHFADADNLDSTYPEEQLSRFEKVLAEIKNRGISIPIRHMANSAAALAAPGSHLDMIRLGISMYGLWPSNQLKIALEQDVKLIPAMTLNAQISHLKEVSAGRSISYSRAYFTPAPQKIATLPIGYADGLTRMLSEKMSVSIKGNPAPIVGNICMDQCMADVSHIDGVKKGDTAVLFGSGGLTADHVADLLGTINYEIVCMVGKRVPRRYE